MNNQYDNQFSNTVLTIVGTIVRTVERSIVVFWDGLRNATEHGTPSLLGFVAAFLPVLTPLPIAVMTGHSLAVYFGWEPWQANTMSAGIEGAGFVLWVTLTETFIRDGWRGTVMQFFFSGAVVVYMGLLIGINVSAAQQEGNTGTYALLLVLMCLFPALSAIAYGYRNHDNTSKLERQDQAAAELAEKIRQEKREDRKELQRLKLSNQFNADVPGVKLEDKPNGKKFRG